MSEYSYLKYQKWVKCIHLDHLSLSMILVPQNRGVLVNDLDLILMLDDANSMTFTNKKIRS